jgi:ATP-dependent helicase HrpB
MFVSLNHKGRTLSQLPIEAVIPQLLSGLSTHRQLILQAEPGAGKSTFFPLTLIQSGTIAGKIVMLEPRRLAAKSIASFIAQQLGEPVGVRVGYRIRGEAKVSAQTQLEIVTEGILTRMLQSDPELSGIDLVIFDEFHERSLHADLALALSLEVQGALRDDLKLVVMSATLDVERLQQLMSSALRVRCEGRSYPIEVRYSPLKANESFAFKMGLEIVQLLGSETGSILAFLPGIAAIKQVEESLRTALQRNETLGQNVAICPLYGQLSFSEQQKALLAAPAGHRKVVLATNVAETSLTIEGIRVVVDSGLERNAYFDPACGVTRLTQSHIAQSSAQQRAGRAGRLEPGLCVRLYSESQFKQQAKVPPAEILHSDLSALAMELANWGIQQVGELSWLDIPPEALLAQGRALLHSLSLTDINNTLTRLGQSAYRLGIEPRLASMLVQIQLHHEEWLHSAIACAALIENRDNQSIDMSVALHLWQQKRHTKYSMLNQRSQDLSRLLNSRFELNQVSDDILALCASLAFPDRIAQMRSRSANGDFKLANGHGVQIRDEPRLSQSEFLVVCDLMRHQHAHSQVLFAAALDIDLLIKTFPSFVKTEEYVDWDDQRGRLVAEKRITCGQIVVKSEPRSQPNEQKMTQALLNYVQRKGLSVLNLQEETLDWLERVRCAVEWLPNEAWPLMDEHSLLTHLDEWLGPYMNTVRSLKDLNNISVIEALEAYLGWPLNQKIEQWLPKYHQLPTGSRKRIRYQVGHEPILSVRIQEVFGEQQSPLIAQGSKRLVLELLSPAQRPIQVTQDLAAFWVGSYKDVQKEMKGRYPKHIWPDDPANHIATTKTKRHFNQ